MGALFVGLPALYWYLTDYHFTDTRLKDLENGAAPTAVRIPERVESKDGTVQEIFEVESKRSS